MPADGTKDGVLYEPANRLPREDSPYQAAQPKRQRMDRATLKALLDAEKVAALAAMQSSKLSAERDDALMYYINDMSKDLPTQDGRSGAVSSDVADTIEGMMPQMMEIFCGSEEVLKFDPTGPEDVEAAAQETDYVNHVLMTQNPGFLILYSFIKDALLSKVGIVKLWWETREEEEKETYYDLTDDQFAILAADPDVEIVEHTEKPARGLEEIAAKAPPAQIPGVGPQQLPPEYAAMLPQAQNQSQLHDVKVVKRVTFSEPKVLGVPPEEFGIEKTARSLRSGIGGCNYCFHRVIRTQSDLINEGFDEFQIKSLPTYMAITNAEEINRDTVAEHQNVGEEHNPASRRIEVVEHYIRMDYEGDGRARLYKVTTGSEQGILLERDGELDVEEVDDFPFVAMTPVIVTHRFFGRSIADLVMDIQRIKTSLLRSLLDNAYLANNPRTVVSEIGASENTLDDLLVSRPGNVVRVKGDPNSTVVSQELPVIGNHVYPLLEYQDAVREMRTGVSKQGQAIDAKALQNQSATAVNQVFTMAQARTRLVARIFAETGIKDLVLRLHELIRKHGQSAQTIRLRNQWVNIDPREWKKRNDMSVEVGLGTGGKAEQMALIQLIIGAQEKALQGGLTNIVTPANLYNSAKQLTRIAGHKDVDAFFTNPATQPPPQPQQNPEMIKAQVEQMKIQGQQQIQEKKMQSDVALEQARFQADSQLEQQKFEHQKILELMEMGMKREEHAQKMAHEDKKAQTAMAQAEHQAQLNSAQMGQKMQLDKQSHDHQMQKTEQTAQHKMAATEHQTKLKEQEHKKTKVKEVVRDSNGRITHVVEV